MNIVADTGPLLAAANRRDRAHELAAALVAALGRELVIPLPVVVETDQLLRGRVGAHSARLFLASLARDEHQVAFLSPRLLHRAAQIDAHYAGLNLGFTDASVMAYADRHDLPILTFDFEDFRATRPESGYWRLVVDEARYADATGR